MLPFPSRIPRGQVLAWSIWPLRYILFSVPNTNTTYSPMLQTLPPGIDPAVVLSLADKEYPDFPTQAIHIISYNLHHYIFIDSCLFQENRSMIFSTDTIIAIVYSTNVLQRLFT